jgi:hypothetical protein
MSYFQPEQMEDTSFEAGSRIFDGMLAEITKAEAELAAITANQVELGFASSRICSNP